MNIIARDQLRRRQYEGMISSAIEYIQGIESKLHRIVLSGDTDTERRKVHCLDTLETAYGKFRLNPDYSPEERGGKYEKEFTRLLKGFQINAYVNPTAGYIPPIMVEVIPKGDVPVVVHKRFLTRLNRLMPSLKVSTVEYTTDQFCLEPLLTRLLMYIERRALYFPYQRSVRIVGGESLSAGGKTTEMNLVCHFDGDDKIYTRGNDKEKKGKGWHFENLDRVRLEHTANRKELVGYGIRTLDDLLNDPKFYEMNRNRWGLRRFKLTYPSRFPREWDEYIAEYVDEWGEICSGTFQTEYLATKGKVQNPSQHIEDLPNLKSLRSMLIESMKRFDLEWKSLN